MLVLPDALHRPTGFVFARELATGRESVTLVETTYAQSDGEAVFRFVDLPVGRYEVSVLGGVSFEPAQVEVEVPCEELRFEALSASVRAYRFEVHAGGVPVTDFTVCARFHGSWVAALDGEEADLPAVYDEWLVLADGFRPARGRLTGLEPLVEVDPEGGELRLVRVELAPGQGDAIQCLDVEGEGQAWMEAFGLGGAPLAGVELRTEEGLVATSDARGLLVLDAAHEPQHVELRKAGWRFLEIREEEGLTLALFARQWP